LTQPDTLIPAGPRQIGARHTWPGTFQGLE